MIPAEAVEAAARELYQADGLNLWEKEDESTRAHYLRKSTSALEAAAPHMLAGALAQIDAGEQSIPSNPLANTGLSDAVTWSEVREWLSNL